MLRLQFIQAQHEIRNRRVAERIEAAIVTNHTSVPKRSIIAIITNILGEES
jgi:hypothetical protein